MADSPSETSRPRRSAVQTSYLHLLKAPVLSEDEVSASATDSDPEQQSKPRRRPSGPPSDVAETDVSEYEEEEDVKGKGKGKAAASSDDDDDSDQGEMSVDSGSEGSEPEGSIATDHSDSEPSKPSGSRKRLAGSSTTISIPLRLAPSIGVPSATSTSTPSYKRRRDQVPQPRASHKTSHFQNNGPLYEPPFRFLEGSSFLGEADISSKPAADEDLRARLLAEWCDNPLGPNRKRMQDIGWSKGKWTNDTMSRTWGGWYSDFKECSQELVHDSELRPFLPSPLYTSRPSFPTEEGDLILMLDVTNGDLEDDGDGMKEEEDIVKSNEPIKIWIGDVTSEAAQVLMTIPILEAKRLDDYLSSKPGYILNAGGAVSSVAWAYPSDEMLPRKIFLAVSTISEALSLYHSPNPRASMIQIWSLDLSVPSDLSRSTVEGARNTRMTLEISLCITVGDALDIQWCPRGGEDPTLAGSNLGLLAGTFTDGSLSIFVVPDPLKIESEAKLPAADCLHLRTEPILRLVLENTSITCFTWASHETIIAGCTNGWISVWDVGQALRDGVSSARPVQYFKGHSGAVRSIVTVAGPPLSPDLDGELYLDGETTAFISGGYEGTNKLFDLRDTGSPTTLSHDRGVIPTPTYSPFAGVAYTTDAEGRTKAVYLRPSNVGTSKKAVAQQGIVTAIRSSQHHPFLAIASADGTCVLADGLSALRKKSRRERHTLEDNKSKKPKALDEIEPPTSGAWPAQLGISCVDWHPSLRSGCLLATGMNCGLVRVDWLERVSLR